MSQCLSPFYIKATGFAFPCGKCYPCLSRRVSGWSFRLIKEGEARASSHFVTLTYSNETVPITPNGFMTLKKRDVQLFMKRLRKAHVNINWPYKISYFLVGEYGGKTRRPHYHAIMFDVDINLVDKVWADMYGAIHCGTVTGASVGYTLKYMMKDSRVPEHKNDDRVPEFQLMSKKLGACYINDRTIAWHRDDILNRYYMPLEDKKLSVPRYYQKYISTQEERQLIHQIRSSEQKQLSGNDEQLISLSNSRKLKRSRLKDTF